MKRLTLLVCMVLVVAFTGYAQDKKSDDVSSFQTSKAWNKLDSATQNAWLDAMKTGDTGRRMDCFVRVRAPADRGDESFLLDNGFDVRMFAGNVASGHMKAGDVPGVANLPFVDSIKLSTKSK